MARTTRRVYEILIPIHRDQKISDGGLHTQETWDWFRELLREWAEGVTIAPGEYTGEWIDEDHEVVQDLSRKYSVAVPDDRLHRLPEVLRLARQEFFQRRIYYQVVGEGFIN